MLPFLARLSIAAEKFLHISVKSSGPLPLSVSIASITSILFPVATPRGTSIFVIYATVFFPAPSPIATIFWAKVTASSIFFINAPEPVVTSSTILSLPAASFLLIIEAAINGILSTVAVTSLNA